MENPFSLLIETIWAKIIDVGDIKLALFNCLIEGIYRPNVGEVGWKKHESYTVVTIEL